MGRPSTKFINVEPWTCLRDVLGQMHSHPASRIYKLLSQCHGPS